jgi:predicted nucleic acid-binding protein
LLYLDTSVLVSALTNEPASGRVDSFLEGLLPRAAVISEWSIAEFSAALSIKARIREISASYRNHALSRFRRMITESMTLLPVHGHHFRMAASLADQHKVGLRAGDALHLAIAGHAGLLLCTLDKRQSEAGKALGIATRLV